MRFTLAAIIALVPIVAGDLLFDLVEEFSNITSTDSVAFSVWRRSLLDAQKNWIVTYLEEFGSDLAYYSSIDTVSMKSQVFADADAEATQDYDYFYDHIHSTTKTLDYATETGDDYWLFDDDYASETGFSSSAVLPGSNMRTITSFTSFGTSETATGSSSAAKSSSAASSSSAAKSSSAANSSSAAGSSSRAMGSRQAPMIVGAAFAGIAMLL